MPDAELSVTRLPVTTESVIELRYMPYAVAPDTGLPDPRAVLLDSRTPVALKT